MHYACVDEVCVRVFAWSIVSVLLVAAVVAFGLPAPEVQAGTRTPYSSTQLSGSSAQVSAGSVQVSAGRARVSAGSSSDQVVLLSALSVAAAPVALVSHPVRYVVQAGDSLAGIAARLGVAGGWPVLYAANRRAVGGDPDVIRPGLVLVVPVQWPLARYVVAAGDSLAGCGPVGCGWCWRALYAANRHRIGGDPNVISAGLVLAIPRQASAVSPGRTRPPHRPAPRAVPPVPPGPARRPGAGGEPAWFAAARHGGDAGVAEDHAAGRGPADLGGVRDRAAAAGPPPAPAPRSRPAAAAQPGTSGSPGGPCRGQAARRIGACQPGQAPSRTGHSRVPRSRVPYSRVPGSRVPHSGARSWVRRHRCRCRCRCRSGRCPCPPGGPRRAAVRTGPIVLADHDRLVVTRCQSDDTVYVLRPPGAADPQAILRVASLVLPERRYGELAGAAWRARQLADGVNRAPRTPGGPRDTPPPSPWPACRGPAMGLSAGTGPVHGSGGYSPPGSGDVRRRRDSTSAAT